MKLHIDLCCGLGGWQAPFIEDDSWRSVGLDVDPGVDPDIVADIRHAPLRDAQPVLVTASPPCQPFSTAWNRWVPLPDRDPDMSLWRACEQLITDLQPGWWVIENVVGAQHWFGKADKKVGPYCLWGQFPPFDVGDVPAKGDHSVEDGGGQEAAKIPYDIARSLKRSVELWSP